MKSWPDFPWIETQPNPVPDVLSFLLPAQAAPQTSSRSLSGAFTAPATSTPSWWKTPAWPIHAQTAKYTGKFPDTFPLEVQANIAKAYRFVSGVQD
jgi:hypothetical protein